MGQIAGCAAQFKRGGVRLAGVVADHVLDELFVAKVDLFVRTPRQPGARWG